MRHLFTILLADLLLCAAPAQAQTLKALMWNTNSGSFVTGTNAITFSNSINFASGDVGITAGGMIQWGGQSRIDIENYTLFGEWTFDEPQSVRANLGGTTIGSAVFTAANATAARQALGLQSYTNTLTNSVNDVEIGSTVSNVTIGWTIAPTNATYAVRTLVGASQTNSITNNSSTLARTGLALTSNTTWTLTVGDGLGATNTATTAVNFWNYMMVGRSASVSLSNDQLQNLHTNGGGSFRAFAGGRSRSFTMDGGGQYIYIAYPASFGAAMVGSISNAMIVAGGTFNDFVVTTNTFTNSQNFTNSYLIYRTGIVNGTGVTFVIQ